MRWISLATATATMTGILSVTGCLRVKTDPVEVKPIHITVDINLRIEKELGAIFDDIDAKDPTVKQN